MTKHIKIYSGTSILTNRLAFLLDKKNIATMIKDHKESGRLAGFGATGNSSELFIYETDLDKSKVIIEKFLKEIQE